MDWSLPGQGGGKGSVHTQTQHSQRTEGRRGASVLWTHMCLLCCAKSDKKAVIKYADNAQGQSGRRKETARNLQCQEIGLIAQW